MCRVAQPPASSAQPPLVGVIMGSKSDWETLRHAAEVLAQFGVPHECRIVSAHRTPQTLTQYAGEAEARGLEVIIAGAGGAAHLPGNKRCLRAVIRGERIADAFDGTASGSCGAEGRFEHLSNQ